MTIIVQKYGGSSLASAQAVAHCAEHVARAVDADADSRTRLIVIVSAMGRQTDGLVDLARAIDPNATGDALDALLAGGEQQSAAIMTLALRRLGIDAALCSPADLGISTDLTFGDAAIRTINPARMLDLLQDNPVLVGPGYQGIGPDGRIRTLGRGGSDTTAVAIAAGLHHAGCEVRCEIYTDVAAVCTADPHLIPSSRPLEVVDADWMSRYAGEGAKVLHDRAADIARQTATPVYIGCSRSGRIGTLIAPARDAIADVPSATGSNPASMALTSIGCTLRRGLAIVRASWPVDAPPDLLSQLEVDDVLSVRVVQHNDMFEAAVVVRHGHPAESLLAALQAQQPLAIDTSEAAIVAAIGTAGSRFTQLAIRTNAAITSLGLRVASFELQGGCVRWYVYEDDALALLATVHEHMIETSAKVSQRTAGESMPVDINFHAAASQRRPIAATS